MRGAGVVCVQVREVCVRVRGLQIYDFRTLEPAINFGLSQKPRCIAKGTTAGHAARAQVAGRHVSSFFFYKILLIRRYSYVTPRIYWWNTLSQTKVLVPLLYVYVLTCTTNTGVPTFRHMGMEEKLVILSYLCYAITITTTTIKLYYNFKPL